MKIKNIILDFGGVVFDHKHIAVGEYLSKNHNLLNGRDYNATEVWRFAASNYNFLTLEFWLEYASYLNLSPKIGAKIYEIFVYTDDTVFEVEQFILDKKSQDFKIYYLTNTKEKIFETRSQTQIFQVFDGGVTDLEAGFAKPSPEIYQFLFSKYLLEPVESVMIDDLAENILGAQTLGASGIHFTKGVTNLPVEFENILKTNVE